MMDATTLVVDGLATYRLSRLIARDTFPPVAKAREWWFARHPLPGQEIDATFGKIEETTDDGRHVGPVLYGDEPGPYDESSFKVTSIRRDDNTVNGMRPPFHATGTALGEVVECSACNSVWVGAGVVAARTFFPRWWDPIAKLLAVSAVAIRLSDLEPDQ